MTEKPHPPAAYRLSRPERPGNAVIFASPHSGAYYPDSLQDRSVLDLLRLRSSEDAFVDRLLATVPDHGATLIAAEYPRAWVDLNRAEDELDSALIAGDLRPHSGPRVAAGLGVIPRVVAGGRSIYRGKITLAEAQTRLNEVWRPYHAQLGALIHSARARHGQAILIDVHSMPSEALDQMGARRPQIVLGDRYGASAARDLVARLEAVFADEGLQVARNAPFAGAYIAQRYGRPSENVHVVQIEIDRSLYMDEARIEPSAEFQTFSALMERVILQICTIGTQPVRLAAE
ncbi:N-formylglutamate amidohydrolase [Thioclava dalianensis]|uniref:N-formylglutamate amidohydrolase n=1 Tax=Thioclava dalianensis TaxID=1185766 RepID=A0A074TDS7_9RHOB|nr:N-formylglutamate amidohydrolase [Thioclava dalianensis]KEP69844.1 N-formylglutamate amidohydrolase [Thioclava dalianensis]SFM87609.1 N-formylglutamate amidohydrolase [Thioclava dalianensis]